MHLRQQQPEAGAPATTETNGNGKKDRAGDALLPHADGDHLWHKFETLGSTVKVSVMLIVVLSIVIASSIYRSSKTSEFFTAGQLTSAQVFAFIVCLIPVISRIALELFSKLHDEPVVFKRLILSEESEAQLTGLGEFSFYMILFFVCDRTSLIPREKKRYDQDTFWFLCFCLLAGALFTLKKAKPPKSHTAVATPVVANNDTAVVSMPISAPPPPPEVFHVAHLQRDQTEEWKGWMQVMFLWYHYFDVKPIYNVIRLYIAAYVWMTGFGNFSYYYIRKDFSLSRFLQMQWRLNFMVIWVCAILSNEYMLYYICMLHTFFTLLIYGGLGTFPQYNVSGSGVAIKFTALALFCFAMWDISDNIFDTVWKPLTFLVQYHDPYSPARDIMHEWRFRSFLDHYIWIVGMLCAFNHPRIEAWLQKIDHLPAKSSNFIKSLVVGVCLVLGYFYVTEVFLLPKKDYNRLHPYTSFIPILLFIVLRNISQTARMYHLHLFEFLGKTTLETYIAQFHIWMATTGVNGAPKRLLRILPSGWPLVNFALVSIVFFYVSYRLFQTTNVIKAAALPPKASNEVLKKNVIAMVCALAAFFTIASVVTMF
ncbi:acyltransferase-like protein, putative [Bodo saltans]|uniref:Acyltransferase-like protein, putative n=1 Tax=Bodo saltans TaxID=75058 RepID=A0A0S4IUZ7_BODSA|nr:acyltransferase-like protein, putative [Bodo saltans]|eukprot:CUF96779.1 acyltransferase-like protein, putative [Bodo saltans]